MDLQELCSIQHDFDKRHGWAVDAVPPEGRLEVLERETIGLTGEVGELANLVKKARLRVGRNSTAEEAFGQVVSDASEELTDALIYLIRLFQLLGADIEENYTRKLRANAARYREYERGESL